MKYVVLCLYLSVIICLLVIVNFLWLSTILCYYICTVRGFDCMPCKKFLVTLSYISSLSPSLAVLLLTISGLTIGNLHFPF